jgi:hypothetical protein
VTLLASVPEEFGNAGTDPVWGTCPARPCTTGADGGMCQNGGTAIGILAGGGSVAESCSCDCTGTGREGVVCNQCVTNNHSNGSERGFEGCDAITDDTIGTAVALWFSNQATATAQYGHIRDW